MRFACAVVGAALLLGSQALAGPQMPIEQALKIATNYLNEKGFAREHGISSLALEQTNLLSKDFRWIAKWSPAIDQGDRKETGLQISPDGNMIRIVTKSAREAAVDTSKRGARAMR